MSSDKNVLLKLSGEFIDIMFLVNLEHKANVVFEKGVKVLYLTILKEIYGCIKYVLRRYELLSQTLENEGFIIKPYDHCVAKKLINGKLYMVVWYVNDNKLSHADPEVVTEVLELMRGNFGDLEVHRGNECDFLGMGISIKNK